MLSSERPVYGGSYRVHNQNDIMIYPHKLEWGQLQEKRQRERGAYNYPKIVKLSDREPNDFIVNSLSLA